MTSLLQPPVDLVNSLNAGKVRLFVGSGPSISAGLAGWDDLIDEMAQTIRTENHDYSPGELEAFLKKRDYLDIAELFRATVGPYAYYRFLRGHYRRSVRPTRTHLAIARMPVRTIFTTNYDQLIETTIHKVLGTSPAVIIQAEQLNYIDDDEMRVVKVHGDIDHPGSIVLTRSDYAAYAARHRELADVLRTSLNGWTVLFVGFGLRDPNFQRIYADARHFYDSTKRQAYALMAGTNHVERTLWHDDGLTIVPLTRRSQVSTVLNEISGGLRRPTT